MSRRDGQGERVHLVVTCANRKSRPVPSPLRLRHVRGPSPATRATAWLDQLEGSREPTLPARDLYAGEHWQVVRGLEQTAAAAGLDVNLWVCSAGYGLVPAGAFLRPYAATFTTGHLDSVCDNLRDGSSWWTAIAAWPGPESNAPRTLQDLARREPNAYFLLALSSVYLTACAEDVRTAAAELASSEHLTIISAGTEARGPLGRHLVPASARLQSALGGTRQSLNVRILTHLVRHPSAVTYTAASRVLEGLLEVAPPLATYQRTPRTDTQVATFIRRRLATKPDASASRLLREFRDLGFACEQHRFGALYRAVWEDC
jgi:hypothetical protein